MNTHSSIEPSCEPQAAANRYCTGRREFECWATLATDGEAEASVMTQMVLPVTGAGALVGRARNVPA